MDPSLPALLKNVGLFAELTEEQRTEIAQLLVEEKVAKGTQVVSQGGPGDRLYIVVSGRFRVVVRSSGSNEMVLATPGPNDVFGELALLDGQPRSASVEATEKGVLLSLSRDAFFGALVANRSLTEAIIGSLSSMVRRLTDQTADAVFHDVHERVARLLVRLSEEKQAMGISPVKLERRSTQADVATIIGRSPESVNDILRSFERLGCLSIEEDVIEVRDLEKLQRHLEEGISWSQLTEQVYHDPLTKLGNRVLFRERVASALANAMRSGKPVAVLFLDLDGFKAVNDTYGHAAGDQLLQRVAERLLTCVRKVDTVARLGGDEFAIVLEDMLSATNAPEVARRIISKVSVPISLGDSDAVVGTSIGVSVFDDGNRVLPDDLVKQADAAMYAAKLSGKGRFVVHPEELEIHMDSPVEA